MADSLSLTLPLDNCDMSEETSNSGKIPGKRPTQEIEDFDSFVIDEQLREIIDFLPQQILVLDVEGRLLHANKMVLEYTGRTLEEMRAFDTRKRIGNDIHPGDVERINGERDRRLAEGQPFEFELRVKRKDGVYRWFLFRYKPMLDAHGNIQSWYCAATDIEEMKSTDEELRVVVDTIETFLHTARPDGLVDYLNRRWLDYLGLPLDEALGRCDVLNIRDTSGLDMASWNFSSVIHPEDVNEITTVWQRIIDTKVPEDAYARIRRFDGAYRCFLFRTYPRFDYSGKLIKWYGAATDIEDSKRTEEKLRNKEIETANQLRQVINTMPGLGWTARPDGQADFLNQQWFEYSGLSPKEALGWGFLVTIHPDDYPQMMADWQRSLGTGEFFETEGRVRRHDGDYRRFLFRGNPVRDGQGNIVKWIGIDTDVEDRKRAEEALRASEQSLRLVIDTIPGLVHVTSPTGEVEYVSQKEIDYFGKTLDELKNWACVVHPDDQERLVNYWQDRVNTGDLYDTEVRLLRADGVFRWIHMQGVPLRNDAQQIIRWYFLMTDVNERKKVEAELQRSEAYLLEAQRLSRTGSFGCDTATGELTWSDETFRIFDYEQSVTPSVEHILRRAHPDDRAVLQAQMDCLLNSRHECDVEFRVLFPDGSIKHLRMVAHTVKCEQQGFIGAVTDITEQTRTHDALQRSERYLQDSQRLSKAGSFAWIPSTGAITYLSDEAFRICGFDAAAGVPTFEECLLRVHPDDRSQWQSKIEYAVGAKTGYTIEHRLLMPDGTVRHLDLLATPKLNEAGELVEFVGTVMDITERWKAQEALRENEYRLRLLIEAIPTFIWCAAPDGSLVYANQRLCNYAGKTLEEVLGWNWGPLVHPDDVEQTRASWLHCLKHGSSLEITQRLRRADSTYRWFQTLAEPLRDRENRIIQWYGLNIDIEESRNLTEALRASQARLSRATQIATVAELSASIAHEISQPLGAVVANGDACEMWLSSEPPNIERARLAVQRIIRDGNDAAEVIQRIRALFKQTIPNKLHLDMNEVVSEVLQLVSPEFRRKNIKVEIDLDPALPNTAADRIQMQQVMINLVHNGIESMENVHDRPRVLILRSRSAENDSIIIEVCDHGPGIDDVEKVFEPFFTTKEKGMGMGLSICRSIIDSHGGVLRAKRNKEFGTTFSFTIPILGEEK
jgi:PAS domain S-box-containing protein